LRKQLLGNFLRRPPDTDDIFETPTNGSEANINNAKMIVNDRTFSNVIQPSFKCIAVSQFDLDSPVERVR
jgi:hypothetical protein